VSADFFCMVPPSPTTLGQWSESDPGILFAHADWDVVDQIGWLADAVGQVTVAYCWNQIVERAAHCWPIVFIHQSMISRRGGAQKATKKLKEFGSRIILVTHPEERGGASLAKDIQADEWVQWSPEKPAQLAHCVHLSKQRHLLMSKLKEQDSLYKGLQCMAQDGLWDWDLTTDTMHVSERFYALLGRSFKSQSILPEEWLSWVHPDDSAQLQSVLHSEHPESGTIFQRDVRMKLPNGTWRWLRIRGAAEKEDSTTVRLAGSISDIQRQRDAWKSSAYDAIHDAVTGLPNECALLDRINRCTARSSRTGEAFAVIHLDVDRFKLINEALGPTLGDTLLKCIADRLRPLLARDQTLARIGADSFGILLDSVTGVEEVDTTCKNLRASMARPFFLGGLELYITLSVGFTVKGEQSKSARKMLADAERAQRAAKTAGCNNQAAFEEGLAPDARDIVALEADLHRAIQEEEFVLHYQPLIPLNGDEGEAYEALIRWQHPTRGWVSPGQFIPLAEDTGLIISLGHWVLRTAFRQAWEWYKTQPESPPRININLSAIQLQQEHLIDQIKTLFSTFPLPKGVICLEITETALMKDLDQQIQTFHTLRALGAEIHIDDFGTGYSSLAQLAQLPVDALKIDRSFVSKMETDSRSAAVVQAIARLAQSLDMRVTAEGVETQEQLRTIKSLHCTSVQGFLFSKAVAPDKARQWTAAHLSKSAAQITPARISTETGVIPG